MSRPEPLTFSRKWTVEHCRTQPMSLCGFHVTELARSMPASLWRNLGDSRQPPPHAASMWSHMSYLAQMSAIGFTGSKAPKTVVPQVQFT